MISGNDTAIVRYFKLERVRSAVRFLQAAMLLARNMTSSQEPVSCSRVKIQSIAIEEGVTYDLYEPGRPAQKTFILIPGVTLVGEHDPRLVSFARSLARSGIRVAAIGLPALKRCRFQEQDVQAIRDLAVRLHDAYATPIGLMGFSLGGGYALVAASDSKVGKIIDPLILLGPHYCLQTVWESILQTRRREPGHRDEWDLYIWVRLVQAYRFLESLPVSPGEKAELNQFLQGYCHRPTLDEKIAFYEQRLKELPPLTNPFLEGEAERLTALSPKGKLGEMKNRVYILQDANDLLVPPTEAEGICRELPAAASPGERGLLITPLLSHVTAKTSLAVFDFFRILRILSEIFR